LPLMEGLGWGLGSARLDTDGDFFIAPIIAACLK